MLRALLRLDGSSDGGARRAMALALAVLSVTVHLSSFAHLLVVRHVTCLEHGEIIHAVEAQAKTSTRRRGEIGQRSLEVAVTASAAHRHEQCLVWAHRRERANLERASSSLRAEAPPRIALDFDGVDPRPSAAAILLLAPKNSPPA
jgi:hypothetical protein